MRQDYNRGDRPGDGRPVTQPQSDGQPKRVESPKVEHEGKTYYLCCPGCAKSFKANPGKYIDKKPAGT